MSHGTRVHESWHTHECVMVHVEMSHGTHIATLEHCACVAVCCSVLQYVAVCCSVLQCVAVCCSVLQCAAVRCSVLQCVAVCCSVLQCVAVCACHHMTHDRHLHMSHMAP